MRLLNSGCHLLFALLLSGIVATGHAQENHRGVTGPLVDCDHPSYSSIETKEVLLGYTLIGVNSSADQVVIGFSESMASDRFRADSVFQIAGWSIDAGKALFDRWSQTPLETRIVSRSVNGYRHLTIHLLGPAQQKFDLVVDAYGCGARIRRDHGLDKRDHIQVKGVARHRVHGLEHDLYQAVEQYLNQPLISDPEDEQQIQSWSYCGHGGPGTTSCSVSLPFGLGCSAECGPGYYACCNTFGGCSCKPNSGGGDGGCDGGPNENEEICGGCTWYCTENEDGDFMCECL